MKNSIRFKRLLKDLFSSQLLAVLATQNEGQPYGSLVAFTATEDLKYLLFATNRSTRKYDNMTKDPWVALVMDNRTNKETDFHKAVAVTATGMVEEVKGMERNGFLKFYLFRHPYLEKFVTSSRCALLRIRVDSYYLVSQFQKVRELRIRQ